MVFDVGVIGDEWFFYEGKVVVVLFFVKNFLLLLISICEVIEMLDNDIMEFDEVVF